MDKVILFTTSYPYGKHETYLEDELIVLSNKFETIEIFPLIYKHKNVDARVVPNNVIVNTPVFPLSKFKRVILFVKGFSRCQNIGLLWKEFYRFRVYTSPIKFKSWIFSFFHYVALLGSKSFQKIESKDKCIFYFYWGTGWPLLCLKLQKKLNRKIFLRLHGSDCYIERSMGYLPVRSFLYNYVDFILPISADLKQYLISKYSIESSKIFVSPLGVKIHNKCVHDSTKIGNRIKIASCSSIIKLKRIDLIIKALFLLDNKRHVDWVHFGSGNDEERIFRILNNLKFSTINIHFMGHVNKYEIIEYYKSNYIHCFLNVSEHEGVPVSIMEAMSVGIPCIATDVGATRELVNDSNGKLIPKNFEIRELAKIIEDAYDNKSWVIRRYGAYNFCSKNYNAEINAIQLSHYLRQK